MILVPIAGGLAAAALLTLWYLRTVWFHRDPDHSSTPQSDRDLRSPVYGIVAYVRKIEDGSIVSEKKGERILVSEITKEDVQGGGWLIGIAMTALDVHFQYAPIASRLDSSVHHSSGRNLPMFDLWEYIRITWFRKLVQLYARKYVFENERQTMWFSTPSLRYALVLIADKFVDKVTTIADAGTQVLAGEKLSFIGRGSQVDVVICDQPNLHIHVKPGDPVRGPATVIARISEVES